MLLIPRNKHMCVNKWDIRCDPGSEIGFHQFSYLICARARKKVYLSNALQREEGFCRRALHIYANIFMHTTFMRTIEQLAYCVNATSFLPRFDNYTRALTVHRYPRVACICYEICNLNKLPNKIGTSLETDQMRIFV